MMVVVNTKTEAAAASLSSQPLVSASAHTGLWSLCAPEYFYPNSARPGQPRLTPLHQGERKLGKGERGERFPRVMRGRRGESAQHSRVLENGDMLTVAQPAPSLLVLCMRCSRFEKRFKIIQFAIQFCRKYLKNLSTLNSVVGKILTFLGWSQVCGGGAAAPGPAQRKLGSVRRVAKFQTF